MKSNFAAIDSGETKTIHEFIERHLEPNEREKKLFGEVFTPLPLVQEMLGSIEKYADKDFWKNPNLKILDPAAGIGNFPLIAYEKLMEGLKSVKGFKGEEARRKHILEKMLYMVELNPNNVRLMNKIFNGKKYKLNVLCTDFLLETEADIKKHDGLSSRQKADGKRLLEWKTMKFDLVMGNPPYNEKFSDSGSGALPLYHKFINIIIDKCRILMYVIPSRWFSGGKGLDSFRDMMMSRKDIQMIKTFDTSEEVFKKDTNVEGGVCYFIKDSLFNGKCMFNGKQTDLGNHDIVFDPSFKDIVKKIEHLDSITKIYLPSSFYGIRTNDKTLMPTGTIPCYVSLKRSKSRVLFINDYKIPKEKRCWKVLTARANGKRPCFGKIIIASPNEIFTDSYIAFKCSCKEQCRSLESYLKTDIVNTLLSLRKPAQDISESACKWIPLVPLDREWNDEKLSTHLKLTKNDMKLIHNHCHHD
jgi:site-specific DNA-methyltransferase (adenine-specific)